MPQSITKFLIGIITLFSSSFSRALEQAESTPSSPVLFHCVSLGGFGYSGLHGLLEVIKESDDKHLIKLQNVELCGHRQCRDVSSVITLKAKHYKNEWIESYISVEKGIEYGALEITFPLSESKSFPRRGLWGRRAYLGSIGTLDFKLECGKGSFKDSIHNDLKQSFPTSHFN